MQVKVGSDPELFLKDPLGNFVSAHDLIPGSKQYPHQVSLGAIQPDGVALEFNTDPASTKEEFTRNISVVLDQLEAEYKKVRPDLQIVIEPTAIFSREYFDSLPLIATELGCQPDFNAYTGKTNKKPETDEPSRTAGGHIHIGWGRFSVTDDEHFAVCRGMIRQFDAVLFLSSLLWDSDTRRRALYGNIGAFRPKTYGVEYRPLSNRWLSSVGIQEFIFEASQKAAMDFLGGVHYESDSLVAEMLSSIHHGDNPTEKEIRQYLRHLNDKFGTPLFV